MINRIIVRLSNPKIFLITIFWLMILVVVGTLAQADIGLYESQQKYFSSWITWFKFIPVPGGRLAISVMFINLFFFVLKPSFWSIKKIGIIIIHFGVLLLLIGAGLTAWFSSEGMMVIEEGKFSNFTSNLYNRELVIVDESNFEYDDVIAIHDKVLKKASIIESSKIPFSIEILDYFTNCSISPRSEPNFNYKGFARNFILSYKDSEKESELNRTGITFRIFNASESVDGIYSLVLDQPITQKINLKDREMSLAIIRERTYLPFSLELIDFKKEMHPGTSIAKSFSSKVSVYEKQIVQSGDTGRSVIIRMNQPLRYKNHTFYQSSFIEEFDKQTTILSVVKNYGRLFPYISSIIIACGILCQIIIRLPDLFRRKSA